MKIQNSKFKIQNFGFTLIELLVVISIVGILASLALVSYTGAQKQTRDTQRRSDLGQYRNSLETFAASNNGSYPSRTGDGGGTGGVKASSFMCPNDLEPGYASSCPADPLGGTYVYRYHSDGSGGGTADATNYILFGTLETGGYWIICSSGKSFSKPAADGNPADSDCGF